MSDPSEVAGAQWSGMSGPLAFDVGAHLGENFPFLRSCGAQRIIAFEPEEDVFDQLLYAEDDVLPLCVAVGGRNGSMELRRANGMLGNITGEERVTSGCVTLDAMALQYGTPDIAVVDVEGFEMQVLAGALRVLSSGRTSWLVEFHSEPLFHLVHDTLATAGYVPEVIRHPHYPQGSGLWLGHGWIKALRPAV